MAANKQRPTQAELEKAVLAWAHAYDAHMGDHRSLDKFKVYCRANGTMRRLAARISSAQSRGESR